MNESIYQLINHNCFKTTSTKKLQAHVNNVQMCPSVQFFK